MRDSRDGGRDEGLTLAELLVALMLFTLLSGVVAGAVSQALGVSRDNEERVTAAHLAAEHVERARLAAPKQLVDAGTAVQSVTVGGVPYTVTRRIEPVDQPGAADSRCGEGPARSVALRVHIDVSWPGRTPRVAPVHSSTLRTISLADALSDSGALFVVVDDFGGSPVAGVTVTAMPGALTGLTNNSGCAVFLDVPPRADYSVTLSKTGYADRAGVTSPRRDYVVVRKAATTKESFVYGPAANLLQPPASLTITQTGCVPAASPAFVGASAVATATAQSTLTLAKPGGVQAGDLLLAHVVVAGTPTASVVQAPAGWTAQEFYTSTFANHATGVWWRRATSADAAGYAWTFPTAAAVGSIVAHRNVYDPTPINASASKETMNGNASVEAPSLTTSSANTTLVAFWTADSPGSWTVPSSMTERVDISGAVSLKAAVAGQPVSAAGSTGNRTATGNTAGKGLGHSVALAPLRLATVSLSWPETTSSAATGYKLDRIRAGVVERTQAISGRTTTSATDSPLVSGLNYSFDLASTTSTSTSPVITRFFTPSC